MRSTAFMNRPRCALLLLTLAWSGAIAVGAELDYKPGGMWMPHQIAELHGETLKKLGLELDPKVFADPLRFPLNAIVGIGASASFVSPEGLVLTNHHCVRRALQYNSTKEHNYIEDGYVARTREQELYSGPGARVYVTTGIEDVTQRMLEGVRQVRDDLERHNLLERREKELVREAEAATPNTRCRVASFYGGGAFYLITSLEIRDVRLVYAPHAGVGYFGGDEDNWMWPRQCGDFAMLRAYVGKDGKPADYSKDNVPYQPKVYLNLAQEGAKEGDLVFVVGYPGSTKRLATAREIEDRIEWEYPRRIRLAQQHIDALHAVADGDKDLTIKAIGSIFGLENGKKKRQGVLQCAERIGFVRMKQEAEQALEEWIAATPERKQRYAKPLETINAMAEERRKTREKDAALGSFAGASMVLGAANTIVRMAEERPKPDAERDPGYQKRNWQRTEQRQERSQKTYARVLDQAVMELYLREAAALPLQQRPEVVVELLGKGKVSNEAVQRKVTELLDGSKLGELGTRLNLLRNASTADLRKSDDTIVQLALRLRPYLKANEERDKRRSGAMSLVRPRYFEAISKLKEGHIAPDANGTIRVAYGTVRGFRPAPDQPVYEPFTNVWQMIEKWGKHRGEYPFNAPPRIIDAVSRRRFGPYAVEELGGVPVDFLTDLDITGGNSGSATLNAKGEITGLVFDGNIEGVGSDLVFQEDVTRGIHADIRYFKWVLDAVEDAGHLLRELRVEPVFAK